MSISILNTMASKHAPMVRQRAEKQPAVSADVFTCPMHPEVRLDHPGECPKCGMALELLTATAEPEEVAGLRDMTRRFWIGAALTLPVFLLAMVHLVPAWAHIAWMESTPSRWVQFILGSAVVCWAGRPLFERGWRSVATRQLNMFTLISIGTGAALLYSAVAMLLPGLFPEVMKHQGKVPVYFEAAAVIVVLVLLGQVLELRARSRTGSAIHALLQLAPLQARHYAPEGNHDVPLASVKMGDWLQVLPGDRVPVDGSIVKGGSSVEESMITGEAWPVAKTVGDKVIGGTFNGTGSFVMQAERLGGDALLGQIVKMVTEAQRSRAPIQSLADKVASLFVPLVLGLSGFTFIFWFLLGPEPRLAFAIVNAVAVLIIACPCALGLATPMSIMVGIGRGAVEGILVKHAAALELLEKVTTLVVDKTGTLTEGRPKVTDVVVSEGFTGNELLRTAASLEANSEHPLADSLTRRASDLGIALDPVKDFRSTTGGGVAGLVCKREVLVGKPGFLRAAGITGMEALELSAAAFQKDGKSVVFVAIDGKPAGIIAVADRVKASTPDAIRQLEALGLKLVMLTGDNQLTASAVARQLGIVTFEAGMEPGGKAAYIRKLQAEGRHVVMAGDGINDAPGLSEAEVGIAMGTGTAVAMESAGITLLKGDLRGIVKAIRLSRATMSNIRQNLFFAFLYNALGIPLAAGLLYPFCGWLLSPMIAGAAMSMSSVSVIGNALRLRKVKL